MIDKYIVNRLKMVTPQIAEVSADLMTRSQSGVLCACQNGAMCEEHARVYELLLEAMGSLDAAREWLAAVEAKCGCWK